MFNLPLLSLKIKSTLKKDFNLFLPADTDSSAPSHLPPEAFWNKGVGLKKLGLARENALAPLHFLRITNIYLLINGAGG